MSLILIESDWEELCQQAPNPQPDERIDNLIDNLEEWAGVPEQLGCGYHRSLELTPGLWLDFYQYKFHQDLMVKAPVHEHPIQIGIHLSGHIYFDAVHPSLSETCGYFSGSGMSPAYVEKYRGGEQVTIVSVNIEPEWLDSFLREEQQYGSGTRKFLFKHNDWKASVYPTVTPAMRLLVQQIWNAPYRGAAKCLYLQAKVFELLAMHLDLLSGQSDQVQHLPRLKPETIARLYYAKEILTTQFEHPPSLLELAKQVGLSDRTLRRGFQGLFGTTVIGYLTQQRMQRAKQLLQEGEWTVAEVARTVGYGHLGHFAAAFKRQFGVNPRECLMGKGVGGRG